jgi:hypothetical protein
VAAAVAFGSRGFEAMKQHLTGKGVPYRVNQVPDSPRWQLELGRSRRTNDDAAAAAPGERAPRSAAGPARPDGELRGNSLAQAMPQTPFAGGATDTAQAASGLISTA